MSADLRAFSDPLGPRGRRRMQVASVVGLVVILGLVLVAVRRLDSQGQLDQQDWEQILSASGAGPTTIS